MKKRILSIFLVLVLMLTTSATVLTACNKGDDAHWVISDEDVTNASILTMTVAKNADGGYIVSAVADKDVFKANVASTDFCVIGKNVEETTAKSMVDTTEESTTAIDAKTESTGTRIDDTYVKDNSIGGTYSFVDSKHATFAVNTLSDYYIIYIHKNATVDGKYAAGMCENDAENVSIEISTETISLNSYESNPTFDIVIGKAVLADTIDSSLITFDAGFSGLIVTSAVRTTDTVLTIHTAGVLDGQYSSGDIQFGAGLIKGFDYPASLYIGINSAKAYADFTDVTFDNNVLSLALKLSGSTFKENPSITVSGKDGLSVSNVVLDESKATATVKIAVTAADIAAAIEAVKGATLNLADTATDYNEAISVELVPSEASINANVDFIENTSGETYTATVVLMPSNGTLNDLAIGDITVSGEFTNAQVISVNKTDAGTEVKFTFTTAKDIDDATFTGTLSITAGKLTNLWDNASTLVSTDLYFCSEGDRGDSLIDLVSGFWDTYGDKIKTYGSGASTALSVGKTILEMTGVIESTNAKIDKVYNAVVSLQSDVTAIKNELNLVQERLVAMENTVDRTKYDTAAAGWNNFYYLSDYKKLQNKITNYNNILNSSLVSFLNGDMKVTLYYDTNGDITIPSKTNPERSYRNTMIDTTRTKSYTFNKTQMANPLTKSKNATMSYPLMLKDLRIAIKTVNPYNLGADFYTCFEMQLNYDAVNNAKVSGADNAFTNTCDYLLGASGSKKPLEYFDEMLSCLYNFDSQTLTYKKKARAAITATIIEGHALATLEMAYTNPGVPMDDINTSFNYCKAYLKGNTGKIEVKNGGQWSFVVNREIRLGYVQFGEFCDQASVSGTEVFYKPGDRYASRFIDGNVTKEMSTGVVSSDQARLMSIRAKARNTNLENDMLAAGYNKDMVLKKSDYLLTGGIRGREDDGIKRNDMLCVSIAKGTDDYYVIGKRYNWVNNKLDYTDVYNSDIIDPWTGEQFISSEIFIVALAWEWVWFDCADWFTFIGGKDWNFRYMKFY